MRDDDRQAGTDSRQYLSCPAERRSKNNVIRPKAAYQENLAYHAGMPLHAAPHAAESGMNSHRDGSSQEGSPIRPNSRRC